LSVSGALITASRHSSESAEHYTPKDIVERARLALGGIDLDPASCAEANRVVQAENYFTAEEDGFVRGWRGRVFLNPPGGLSDNLQRPVKAKCRENGSCGLPIGHTHEGVQSNQKKWWYKLAREYESGNVTTAIFVCFSVELLQTSQVDRPADLRAPLHFPICFPSRRVAYVKPGGAVGSQPPHASCIVWLDDFGTLFHRYFRDLGLIVSGAQRE
jgi:hypothetical protein